MSILSSRFKFAAAPDSWGVLDYPGPSWEQSFQKMLDEMVVAVVPPVESVAASLRYLEKVAAPFNGPK
jgi:hypothetical protein